MDLAIASIRQAAPASSLWLCRLLRIVDGGSSLDYDVEW
jgi:hypothetical protein